MTYQVRTLKVEENDKTFELPTRGEIVAVLSFHAAGHSGPPYYLTVLIRTY